MVEVNRMTTPANMRWKIVDRANDAENAAIDWRFRVGDRVNATLNEFTSTPMGAMPRSRRFTVVGIFSMGEHTADSSFAFIALGAFFIFHKWG